MTRLFTLILVLCAFNLSPAYAKHGKKHLKGTKVAKNSHKSEHKSKTKKSKNKQQKMDEKDSQTENQSMNQSTQDNSSTADQIQKSDAEMGNGGDDLMD